MLGLDQIIKNYIMPGWHQTLTTSHLLVNKDVWDKLKPESRALIEMGCESATLRASPKASGLSRPRCVTTRSRA